MLANGSVARGEVLGGGDRSSPSVALQNVGPWEPYELDGEVRLTRADRGLVADIALSDIADYDKESAKLVLNMVKRKPFWPLPKAIAPLNVMAERDDPELLNDLTQFIRERVLFLNEDEYHTLAAWIATTYLKELFTQAPRWYLFGGRSSGKSTCQHWIRLTAYRGMKTVNMTPAAFYRIMDKFSPTLIREESQDEKGELAAAVDQVEKAGYDNDNQIPRCNPNDPDIIDSFDPFGYLARSYRGERPKTDSLSRGFCVVMVNKPEKVRLKGWSDGIEEAGMLRSRLLAFRLRALTGRVDIAELQRSAEAMGAKRFGNRSLDVVVPVLATALAFGEGDQVMTTITRTIRALNDATATEPEALVFQAIMRVYERQPVKFEKGTIDIDGAPRTFAHRDISKVTTNDIIREYNEWLEQEAIDSGTAEIARYRRVNDGGAGQVEVPEYRVPKVPGQKVTGIIKDLGFILSEDRRKGGKRGLDEKVFYTVYGRLLERYGAGG